MKTTLLTLSALLLNACGTATIEQSAQALASERAVHGEDWMKIATPDATNAVVAVLGSNAFLASTEGDGLFLFDETGVVQSVIAENADAGLGVLTQVSPLAASVDQAHGWLVVVDCTKTFFRLTQVVETVKVFDLKTLKPLASATLQTTAGTEWHKAELASALVGRVAAGKFLLSEQTVVEFKVSADAYGAPQITLNEGNIFLQPGLPEVNDWLISFEGEAVLLNNPGTDRKPAVNVELHPNVGPIISLEITPNHELLVMGGDRFVDTIAIAAIPPAAF